MLKSYHAELEMTFWWVESTVKLSCLAASQIRDPLSVSVMDSYDSSSPYMAWPRASGSGARPGRRSDSERVRCLSMALHPSHIYRNLLFIVPSLSSDRLPACLPACLPCLAFLPLLGLPLSSRSPGNSPLGTAQLISSWTVTDTRLFETQTSVRFSFFFFFVIFIFQAHHLHAEKRKARSFHACKARDFYLDVNDSDSYGEFDNGTN